MLTRLVAPSVLPVALADAKANMKVESAAEDAFITALVSTACAVVQDMTGRAMGEQTWRLDIGEQNASERVKIPLTPVSSISSITYYDGDDAQQTATVSDFYLFADDYAAQIMPKAGNSWPATIARDDAISITFVAGGSTPEGLEQAVLLLVSHWHENRCATSEKQMREIPYAVELLANQHKTLWAAA